MQKIYKGIFYVKCSVIFAVEEIDIIDCKTILINKNEKSDSFGSYVLRISSVDNSNGSR